MRRSEVPILVILLVAIFCLLSLHNYPSSQSAQIMNEGPDPRVKGQFKEWKECLQRNITLYQMDPKGTITEEAVGEPQYSIVITAIPAEDF
ncbi:hypothetical protein ANCCAN_02055 [Ancylostoma caninum]|uniref:Uncharacterized protein n=1 Tax=Ancylostoma caninum TaxID=29170 RepID=A0A368H525_ANCCA|nr:hypothetical protein ANCCAN_02055 [Ancylostoma caninum]